MFNPGEVRDILISAARQRTALTYSEMLGALGHAFTRPLMRQLCKVLDRIDEDGRASGEPGLAVLVVRQSDGLPGQGWFVSRTGVYDDLPLECAQARQAEAYEYWEHA